MGRTWRLCSQNVGQSNRCQWRNCKYISRPNAITATLPKRMRLLSMKGGRLRPELANGGRASPRLKVNDKCGTVNDRAGRAGRAKWRFVSAHAFRRAVSAVL